MIERSPADTNRKHTEAKAIRNLNHAFFSQGSLLTDTLAKTNDDEENSLLREPLTLKGKPKVFFSTQFSQTPRFLENLENSLISENFANNLGTSDTTRFKSSIKITPLKRAHNDVFKSTQNQFSYESSLQLDKCLSPIHSAKSSEKIVYETIVPSKVTINSDSMNKTEDTSDSILFGSQSTPMKRKNLLITKTTLFPKQTNSMSSEDEVDEKSRRLSTSLCETENRRPTPSSSSSDTGSSSTSFSFTSSYDLSSILKFKNRNRFEAKKPARVSRKLDPAVSQYFRKETRNPMDIDELSEVKIGSLDAFFIRTPKKHPKRLVNFQPVNTESATKDRMEQTIDSRSQHNSKSSSDCSSLAVIAQNKSDRSIPSAQACLAMHNENISNRQSINIVFFF